MKHKLQPLCAYVCTCMSGVNNYLPYINTHTNLGYYLGLGRGNGCSHHIPIVRQFLHQVLPHGGKLYLPASQDGQRVLHQSHCVSFHCDGLVHKPPYHLGGKACTRRGGWIRIPYFIDYKPLLLYNVNNRV